MLTLYNRSKVLVIHTILQPSRLGQFACSEHQQSNQALHTRSYDLCVTLHYPACWQNWASLCNVDIACATKADTSIPFEVIPCVFHISAKLNPVSAVPQASFCAYWGVSQLESSTSHRLQVLLHSSTAPQGHTAPAGSGQPK